MTKQTKRRWQVVFRVACALMLAVGLVSAHHAGVTVLVVLLAGLGVMVTLADVAHAYLLADVCDTHERERERLFNVTAKLMSIAEGSRN